MTTYSTGVAKESWSAAKIFSGLTLRTPDTRPEVMTAVYSGLAQMEPTRGHDAYSNTGSWSSLSATRTVRVAVLLSRDSLGSARSYTIATSETDETELWVHEVNVS